VHPLIEKEKEMISMRRELAFLVATACAVVASTAVPSPTLATVPAAAIAPENAAQAVELRRVILAALEYIEPRSAVMAS
jgi:hypothetical protein